MKNLLSFLAVLFMFSSAFSQGYHVRIGTIGNSITHGIALPSPLTQAFPVLLDEMLKEVYGDTCIVNNFGLTTTTMLKNGDVSYWDTRHLKDYLSIAPEICFIMLGTNDTKPQNWDVYGDEFIRDYLSMMDTIKARNPSTRFILAYPPPAFEVKWGIRDSIVVNGVIPAIDSLAKLEDVAIMDFYYPLLDSVPLFPDKIHPGVEGNILMAEMLMDRIIETDLIHKADTGLTFITGFETDEDLVPLSGSAELSWTTINADSVLINGVLMEKEGSLQVSPSESTTYAMVAYGQASIDTSSLTLEVYIQELSRLRLSPSRPIRDVGDTVFFRAYHYDQFDSPISGKYPDVTWSIDGSGSLYEETDSSVHFICELPDTTYLEVSYKEGVSYEARIVTRPFASGISEIAESGDLMIYPNPGKEFMNIQVNAKEGPLEVKIYGMKGALQLQKEFRAVMGENIFRLNTGTLTSGIYLIQISYNEEAYTRQVVRD